MDVVNLNYAHEFAAGRMLCIHKVPTNAPCPQCDDMSRRHRAEDEERGGKAAVIAALFLGVPGVRA
jgi:hypothetical protein